MDETLSNKDFYPADVVYKQEFKRALNIEEIDKVFGEELTK